MLILYAVCTYILIGEAIGFWHYSATEPKAGIVSFTYGSLWAFFLLVVILCYALAYILLYITCAIGLVGNIAQKAFEKNKKRMPSMEDTLSVAVKNLIDLTTQLFPPKK